jgi:hypothetical protein
MLIESKVELICFNFSAISILSSLASVSNSRISSNKGGLGESEIQRRVGYGMSGVDLICVRTVSIATAEKQERLNVLSDTSSGEDIMRLINSRSSV